MRLHVSVSLLRDATACRQAHSRASVERYFRDCFGASRPRNDRIFSFKGTPEGCSNKAVRQGFEPQWLYIDCWGFFMWICRRRQVAVWGESRFLFSLVNAGYSFFYLIE